MSSQRYPKSNLPGEPGRIDAALADSLSLGAGKPVAAGPLWQVVARSLEDEIVSGRLPEGSRLPPETSLSDQFGINRHTLRRALGELGRKGLVHSTPQVGHFVARVRIPLLIEPRLSIAVSIERAGFKPGFRVVSHDIVDPSAEIARLLGVAARTPVKQVNMVRLANEMPISFVTIHLPADRFGNIMKHLTASGSMRRSLARAGVAEYRRKSARIVSRTGSPEECGYLGLDPGATLIALEVVDTDMSDEPIAVFNYRFSALRTELMLPC